MCQRHRVPVDTLLAYPEAFHWIRVEIPGYVVTEFEGDAVYADVTLSRRPDLGIWLDLIERPDDMRRCSYHGPGVVTGRFNPQRHGHMGVFGGELEQARIITFTPDTTCW